LSVGEPLAAGVVVVVVVVVEPSGPPDRVAVAVGFVVAEPERTRRCLAVAGVSEESLDRLVDGRARTALCLG
jgi:hypothetical protein